MISRREANLILATIERSTLAFADKKLEDAVRARILVGILERLRCADYLKKEGIMMTNYILRVLTAS